MLAENSNNLSQFSHQTESSDPSNAPTTEKSKRFGIRSCNVMIENYSEPMEAIILIQDQKIVDVIIIQEKDPQALDEIYNNWKIVDYQNLFIFPGLIDSNVHFNANFIDEWENIANCTDLAASGGVTTVVDNPIMSSVFESHEEYIASLNQKIEKIQQETRVDFGVFGALEPRTLDGITKILEAGVLGLKCFLLSTPQHSIGHFQPEDFNEILQQIEEKHPELLLIIHPEMATERDLYLTSPCRGVPLERRLDMDYELKSIELGGGANRGSYIDDLCRKKEEDEVNNDDDGECSIADLDSPTKLMSDVKKTQEKTEINDIVHLELLSYSYERQQKNNDKISESSTDSDDDTSEDTSRTGSQRSLDLGESLKKCSDIHEEGKDIDARVPLKREASDVKTANSPLKRSIFANSSIEKIQLIKKVDLGHNREKIVVKLDEEDNKEDQKEDDIGKKSNEEEETKGKREKVANEIRLGLNSEDKPNKFVLNPLSNSDLVKSASEPPLQDKTPAKLLDHEVKDNVQAESTPKKTLNQTRKLLVLLTASDTQQTMSPKATGSPDIPKIEAKAEESKAKSASTFSMIQKRPSVLPSVSGGSLHSLDSKSPNVSPLCTKRRGSGTSSLLQRRISLKAGVNFPPSIDSTISSPLSNFTKVNSLELTKTPENLARKEAKFNRSYRIFLANRPQNWEENAVSKVIGALGHEVKVRIVLQNLSLASSFLKIWKAKKSNESLGTRLISDTASSYLSFCDKMIGSGETKYKTSPPFRNKENMRLLIENLRLGAVDIISSYHFYVPPRFKQVDNGNFRRAFGGLNSMGYTLQAAWTALYNSQQQNSKKFSEEPLHKKRMTNHIFKQMVKTMCSNPAQVLRIANRKGSIAKGKDADFVIWDPFSTEVVANLEETHVFAGKTLMGVVHKTFLRGNLIYSKENSNSESVKLRGEFLTPM